MELWLNPNGKPASASAASAVCGSGELDGSQRELLQIANACPVHKMLTGEVRIDSTLAA